MKKLLLFSFVALATMFTSCNEGLDVNDPNQYCWKLTASMNGVSETTYVYATGAAISNELEYAKQFGYSLTYAKADNSQCGNNNAGGNNNYPGGNNNFPGGNNNSGGNNNFPGFEDESAAHCYRVTITYMGESYTDYVYATESEMIEAAQMYKSEGYQFSYSRTNDSYCKEYEPEPDEPSYPNMPEQPSYSDTKYCYRVTIIYMGESYTDYSYATESEMIEAAQMYKSEGYQFSYSRTNDGYCY